MKTLTARQIIRKEYGNKSKNFMTPKIIGYGKIHKNMAYEISKGSGFNHDVIYGLSIASYIPEENKTSRELSLSKCFFNINNLWDYIDELKNIHESFIKESGNGSKTIEEYINK